MEEINYKLVEYSEFKEAIDFAWEYRKNEVFSKLSDQAFFKRITLVNLFDQTEIYIGAFKDNKIVGILCLKNDEVKYLYSSDIKVKQNLVKLAMELCLSLSYDELYFDHFIDIENVHENIIQIKNQNVLKLRRNYGK